MLRSNRLYDLRKAKNLSRAGLAGLSKVSVRTIQRLENPAERSNNPRGNTLDRLARALQVEPGVLTGDLPLPDSGNMPASEPRRVQVSAEIAPKARLAYDLVKRRYGVSATEIINMAPLFFALLIEGSLARRREKLEEAGEAIRRLDAWLARSWWYAMDVSSPSVLLGSMTRSARSATAEGRGWRGDDGIPYSRAGT